MTTKLSRSLGKLNAPTASATSRVGPRRGDVEEVGYVVTEVGVVKEAEESLLAGVPKRKGKGIAPGSLIEAAEQHVPEIPGDTVRYAFWSLLGRRVLVRREDGLIVRGEGASQELV